MRWTPPKRHVTRRIFVDTEWTAPPWTGRAELMWIGLADDEGRSWYGISSEVTIDPSANDFISGAFRLISPDEPRLSMAQMKSAVVDFCGQVDEFWAWIPTLGRLWNRQLFDRIRATRDG
jgi:hypothetical protein